jgi:hypothetical protein
MSIGGSHGIIAVLNDLGGSSSSSSGRGIVNALVALNYNGRVDNSGKASNGSTFSFNPDANNASVSAAGN